MKRIVLGVLILAAADLAHGRAVLRVQFLGSIEQTVTGEEALIRTAGQGGSLDILGAGDAGPVVETLLVDGFDQSVDGAGLWTWRLHRMGGETEIMDGLCSSEIDDAPPNITVSLQCISTMPHIERLLP